MKFLALIFLLSTSLFADETKKTEFKETVNRGANNIDKETRHLIKNGKDVLKGKKAIKKNK